MFKKITFRMMVLAVVAMVAGTVSAQESVWTGKITAADYVQGGEIYAPEIDYSITYTPTSICILSALSLKKP